MDTLTFLRRVLPPEGIYAAIVINDGAPQQRFFNDLPTLATNCQELDARGNNVYFAVSSFKKRGSRKQDNVHLTNVIAIDVDCVNDDKHVYKNQRDGLQAVLNFVTDSGLPTPMIISSGRGLHIYWVLDAPLPPEEWRPLADAMKNAHTALNFKVDATVTADSARVLRPTQTHNPKNGAEVKLLLDAPPTSKGVLQNILQRYIQPTAGTSNLNMTPPPKTKGTGLLAAMAVPTDFPPASAPVVVDKCAQIKWGVDNADKVQEPFWYAMLGVAAHCVAAEDTAKEWSQGHPGYDETKTLAKMQQWRNNATGPATCSRFKAERPSGCDKCKFNGKITSPASISKQYDAAPASQDIPAEVVADVPIPYPFERVEDAATKRKFMVMVLDGTHIETCPFEIYPVGYGRDNALGYEVVRYKWYRQHLGWTDLIFRQALLAEDAREFATAIADQGIVLRGKKQQQDFQFMLRAYMEELRAIKSMTNLHDSMGWKENFTQFVIGDRVYKRLADGSVTAETISMSATTNRIASTNYTTKGDLKTWAAGTKVLQDLDFPQHMFALTQGFAAPLWAFGGLKGITVSLFGRSGSGKTLIQMWQQSIWGNPDKLHLTAKTTQNALFNRLGTAGNLPVTIDETTNMEDKDVGEFIFWVTEGKDKDRLTRSAEQRAPKEWATAVTVSTNKSFISKMQSGGFETDAQLVRLLEVPMAPHAVFKEGSAVGRALYRHIMNNYGVPGDAYAKILLALGKDEIERRIDVATKGFELKYGFKFSGMERYWENAFVRMEVAGQIATEYGLIAYDYELGIRWALTQLPALRCNIIENAVDGWKLINEFLNEVAAETLTIMHTEGQPSCFDHNRLPRGVVKARFDMFRKTHMDDYAHGTVMLVSRYFKPWLAARGYDFSVLQGELRALQADATPASGRFWIGRNTALKIGQQQVVGVNLSNEKMGGYLRDTALVPTDLTLGQMTVVK